MKGQPAEFWIEADWTNHDRPVTGLPGFQVLLRVDESTYTPVRDYCRKHGAASRWARTIPSPGQMNPRARLVFYTEFGHDLRSLSTPFARQHVLEGIKWSAAAGKSESKPTK